jgi:serine/threonine protein kinase
VDIWSCGIVLYAMLTAFLPFDDADDARLYAKIEAGIFYIQPYLSGDAQDLLKAMITVDPVRRITIDNIKSVNLFVHLSSPIHKYTTRLTSNVHAENIVGLLSTCHQRCLPRQSAQSLCHPTQSCKSIRKQSSSLRGLAVEATSVIAVI